jgi:hypothetical protein
MCRGTHWSTVTVSNRVKLTGHTISDTFGEAQNGTKLPDHRTHDIWQGSWSQVVQYSHLIMHLRLASQNAEQVLVFLWVLCVTVIICLSLKHRYNLAKHYMQLIAQHSLLVDSVGDGVPIVDIFTRMQAYVHLQDKATDGSR